MGPREPTVFELFYPEECVRAKKFQFPLNWSDTAADHSVGALQAYIMSLETMHEI